ncbi:MAG: hypothetical protein ABS35_22185 [Kaistia sp. SCN 65-12]|nr:MAG: hypothetical protein ABS35_22185 [Kaistia sp. SCN 65-12]
MRQIHGTTETWLPAAPAGGRGRTLIHRLDATVFSRTCPSLFERHGIHRPTAVNARLLAQRMDGANTRGKYNHSMVASWPS